MKSCLICSEQAVEQVIDLGSTALANKFLTKEELSRPEPTFPLRLGFCRSCTHVQLTDIVPPPEMFDDYLYVSGASETLKEHLSDLSDVVVRRRSLGVQDLVVDVGCNDGTLLNAFKRHSVRVLGVDPAANLAALHQSSSVPRCVAFFNSVTAARIKSEWGLASVITLTNTFPHIPDLRDFMKAVQTLLAPGGVLVIEAHYLLDLLEQNAFDTIYHEHVSYWALGPMMRLFGDAGMEVISAERLPLHHGQLRVFVQRKGEAKVSSSVKETLDKERAQGVDTIDALHAFRDRTMTIKRDLRKALQEMLQAGKRIVAYGAPAKGNTLLSFLEIGPALIEYIVDRSPLKQGRFTPGSHIPVVATERLVAEQPDYVLLLAWNFADEVLRQQQEYRQRGGKFIIPVPTLRIVQ